MNKMKMFYDSLWTITKYDTCVYENESYERFLDETERRFGGVEWEKGIWKLNGWTLRASKWLFRVVGENDDDDDDIVVNKKNCLGCFWFFVIFEKKNKLNNNGIFVNIRKSKEDKGRLWQNSVDKQKRLVFHLTSVR